MRHRQHRHSIGYAAVKRGEVEGEGGVLYRDRSFEKKRMTKDSREIQEHSYEVFALTGCGRNHGRSKQCIAIQFGG